MQLGAIAMTIFVALPPEKYRDDAFAAFDPAKPNLDLGNARALMWLSQLAYETGRPNTLAIVAPKWGIIRLTPFQASGTTLKAIYDTRGIVAERADATIVAFAGTDPGVLQNLITDFDIGKTTEDTHQGFTAAFQNAWPKIIAAIGARTQPLIFTGHSLGAALTALAAAQAHAQSTTAGGAALQPALVYVFGMPRAGGPLWAAKYDATLGAKTFRFVHASDVVARVPCLGYQHVGRMLNCESGQKFNIATPLEALGSNDPTLSSGAVAWIKSQILYWGAGKLFSPAGPGPIGWAFQYIAPPLRDHLQDQYYDALAP
jgi:triacylglycerol lipase